MGQESVEKYLDDRDLDYKRSGIDQLLVEYCPCCAAHNHFFINKDTGLWDCKKCRETGNLFTLRKFVDKIDTVISASDFLRADVPEEVSQEVSSEIVEHYYQTLMKDSKAIDYLLKRGISKDSIHLYKLGIKTDSQGKWLAIPYFLNGKPVNFKFRSLPSDPSEKKEFRQIAGAPNPLWNQDALDLKKRIYVTEGEFDAMVLIQAGFTNTVSVPMGCGTFKTEHFDILVEGQEIYLLYDADAPGVEGASDVADRLGPERCYMIDLPTNDISDFFARFSLAEFQTLLDEAHRYAEPTVLNVRGAFGELLSARKNLDEGNYSPARMPWDNVHRIVGNFREGGLIIMQARPKVGKTTMCNQFLYQIAADIEVPTMMFCLEMTPADIAECLVSQIRKKPIAKIDTNDIYYAGVQAHKTPFYIARNGGVDLTTEKVFDTIRYARKRFGVKVVVFDHIHFLCKSDKVTTETSKLVRDFKLLAVELNITIIGITHPTKGNPNEAPGIYSSRDSGEIPGDCDQMWTLHRPMTNPQGSNTDGKKLMEEDYEDSEEPIFETKTLFEVSLDRHGKGGRALLMFDEESMSFLTRDEYESKFEGTHV
jgi:twinkle protein